jgi:hypothetical protein
MRTEPGSIARIALAPVALILVFLLGGCAPVRTVVVPEPPKDAPPSVRITNFEPANYSATPASYVESNGFPGSTVTTFNATTNISAGTSLLFILFAQNVLGGVKSLDVLVMQNGQQLYVGGTSNALAPDGKAPTTLALWGVNSANGTVWLNAQLNSPITVVAKATNFTGGTNTLTEIVNPAYGGIGLGAGYGGGYGTGTGGSSSSECSEAKPNMECVAAKVVGGCEVEGHWACKAKKWQCETTANVDYCTSCGVHGSINCGACSMGLCNSNADCGPNLTCQADPGMGKSVCKPTPSTAQCASAVCWLPKSLATYAREACYRP